MKKITLILLCLCLVSPGFANRFELSSKIAAKNISQAEIVDLIKGQITLIKMNEIFIKGKGLSYVETCELDLNKLSNYVNLLDSSTINDKYSECVKDIIWEITVYKQLVNKLEKYQKNLSTGDVYNDLAIINTVQCIINDYNDEIKIRINKLIEKLK